MLCIKVITKMMMMMMVIIIIIIIIIMGSNITSFDSFKYTRILDVYDTVRYSFRC